MEVKRKTYTDRLLSRRHNGLVKIVTGVRRCGKSYLLFNLFRKCLLEQGVKDDHIIAIALDDYENRAFLDPEKLYNEVKRRIVDSDMYYILLDEIQLVPEFESILNGFLHIQNADSYVTGSNSKFLSSDIITEFRGRGDEVRVYPLSFAEYSSVYEGSSQDAWNEFCRFGGMPGLLAVKDQKEKEEYLRKLFEQTYFSDIISRYNLRANEEIGELMDVIASSIGSLTNTLKLTNTFNSEKKLHISNNTLSSYVGYMEDAFLVERCKRYDVRGKRYISTPLKYYIVDIGLRNARLNFRQADYGHIMENVIYNELRNRGFSVDVGLVDVRIRENGELVRKQLEVDFVVNQADRRYYIQSAYELGTEEKNRQERLSLLKIGDSFKKILVQKDSVIPFHDDNGFLVVGLTDFLLKPEIIDL